jgi:Na+/H+ antiporter NhaD/arsenite permease-like protein
MLQVAMFQAFSPTSNMGIANALTGAGVSIIILVLGIFMIVKANKKLKVINNKRK